MLKKLLFFVFCFVFFINQSKSNALYAVTIEEKIANSNLIIEGKVINKHSFWNDTHTFIFTTNKIKIYKVFKGVVTTEFVEIVTEGGTVGNTSLEASDLLSLELNQIGVFFCYPNTINVKSPLTNSLLLDVYSSGQGFYEYDLVADKVYAPFVKYNSITRNLYPELISKIGNSFTIKDPTFSAVKNTTTLLATPVVTSILPLTVNAGATLSPLTNVLTITGTGFGLPTGSAAILFCDGNTGGSTPTFSVAATDNLVISWTDTQIRLRVPSRGSTGNVLVRESGGLSALTDPITVFYSILTANVDGTTREANLMNVNAVGGYSVLYCTSTLGGGVDLSSSTYLATFQRALATWKETVGMNWIEGGFTSNQAISPSDGQCKIMMDNTNKGVAVLPSGVLAVCYSWYNQCSSSALRKPSFDVVIRNTGVSSGSATFTNGPCAPVTAQIDLETVLLHELGHALGLGHINDAYEGSFLPNINTGKLMHYSVLNGVKRVTPDASSYRGALYTCLPQGNSYGSCINPNSEMTQLSYTAVVDDDCPLSFPTIATSINTSVPFNLIHATSNKNVDPQFTAINCSGTGTAVTNTQFYAIKTNTSGTLNLTVSDYTTSPLDISACGSSSKGVELSLYNVSTCPDGQNFPPPSYCRTFNADGALTSITGLTANTNYLIMCDGINNTKASFNLLLNGTALPIKLASFTGAVLSKYNQLNWAFETPSNAKTLVIEKSIDGVNFESLKEFKTKDEILNTNLYFDNKPSVGNNYYRLLFIENDNTKEFSKIIVLKRKDKILFNISPNPTSSNTNIQISTDEATRFSIVVFSSEGKQVAVKTIATNIGNNNVSLNLNSMSKGIYNVVLYNNLKEIVQQKTIVLQ